MIERTELTATLEDHEVALTEISFLLEVLASTISEVIGQSMPSVAVCAGRQRGKKLPVVLRDPDMQKVLTVLAERLEAGFGITFRTDSTGADLSIGRCAIREVCLTRHLELGGDLCRMLHYYWSGLLTELYGRPVRAGKFTAGPCCTLRMDGQ
jgi:hypothetical protein